VGHQSEAGGDGLSGGFQQFGGGTEVNDARPDYPYPINYRLILNAGDHLGFITTLWADRHIDVKYPLQVLCPSHGLVALFGCSVHDFSTGTAFSAFARRDINTVFAVGDKYSMEPCQISSRSRNPATLWLIVCTSPVNSC
jgi:hypothetical protein